MDRETSHVLLVEDDEDTRFVYSVLLQLEGYYITSVGTVADALARAMSTEYDLIIMDVRLPDGNGVELCRSIRSFNRTTPIMFLSAAAYQKDVERGMKAGAQAYMTKPADTEKLLENVSYLVGKKPASPSHKDASDLRHLITEAMVAAALIDKDRTYKAVSPAYAAAGGYDADELIGRQARDIFPDVSGEAGTMLENVRESRQPIFISRYPYQSPTEPERGVTYWDAAFWPVESTDAGTDILIVIRQKEQSGDIVTA